MLKVKLQKIPGIDPGKILQPERNGVELIFSFTSLNMREYNEGNNYDTSLAMSKEGIQSLHVNARYSLLVRTGLFLDNSHTEKISCMVNPTEIALRKNMITMCSLLTLSPGKEIFVPMMNIGNKTEEICAGEPVFSLAPFNTREVMLLS
jgi:hypothetical protein